MPEKFKVVQVGLGPIGMRITRYLMQRAVFDIVAAIDIDPEKAGRDLGDLAGLPSIGLRVTNTMEGLSQSQAQVALLTTVSTLRAAQPQIAELLALKLNVVSTCEELAYPWITQPDIARQIDRLARVNRVSVLGTGINPGFLMDFLPLALTAPCLDVRKVTVERIQNASARRRPFLKKIGVGLSPGDFQKRVKDKTLGHVGLAESMYMIATRLGWELERIEDRVEPVITDHALTAGNFDIAPGRALGLAQSGFGYLNGEAVISLRFRATVGEPESYDRVRIEGVPNVEMRLENGINGDIGTGAMAVNSIPLLVEATPGLKTMADLPALSCFNAGAAK